MYAKSLGEWGVAEMFAPLVPVPLDVLIAISSLWFMSTAVTLLFSPQEMTEVSYTMLFPVAKV